MQRFCKPHSCRYRRLAAVACGAGARALLMCVPCPAFAFPQNEPPAVQMNDMLGGILTYKARASPGFFCGAVVECLCSARARRRSPRHSLAQSPSAWLPPLPLQLAAEDELRASGVPFAIVRPVALTEEPGGMPLVWEQGDTIKGKVSREVGLSRLAERGRQQQRLQAAVPPPAPAVLLAGSLHAPCTHVRRFLRLCLHHQCRTLPTCV